MKNKTLDKQKVDRLFSQIEVADQIMGVFENVDYLLKVMTEPLEGRGGHNVITFTMDNDDDYEYIVTEYGLSNAVIDKDNNTIALDCAWGRVIKIKLLRTVQLAIN